MYTITTIGFGHKQTWNIKANNFCEARALAEANHMLMFNVDFAEVTRVHRVAN